MRSRKDCGETSAAIGAGHVSYVREVGAMGKSLEQRVVKK